MNGFDDGDNPNGTVGWEGLVIRITSYVRTQKIGAKSVDQDVVCLWIASKLTVEQNCILRKKIKALNDLGYQVNIYRSGQESLLEQTKRLLQQSV